MIRSNVPLPLLFRIRLRANWVARRAQSKLSFYRQQHGGSVAGKLVWSKKTSGHHPGAECSMQLWSDFVDHYDRFIGALCSAAKNGCSTGVERGYSIARRRFAHHYCEAAPRVLPYLDA